MSQLLSPSVCLGKHCAHIHRNALLLLLSNHHHIPAAWHRLGGHGNRTTRLPLPLVSWQQADEMRQWYCVYVCVFVYVCLKMTICLQAEHLDTHTLLFASTSIIEFSVTPCCNNPDGRLLVY